VGDTELTVLSVGTGNVRRVVAQLPGALTAAAVRIEVDGRVSNAVPLVLP